MSDIYDNDLAAPPAFKYILSIVDRHLTWVGLINMESKDDQVENLLIVGIKAFNKPLLPSVTDDTSETLCGWHLANPRPQYKLTGKKKPKKQPNRNESSKDSSLVALKSTVSLPSLKGKGMTGKLTEEYDYIYEGRSLLGEWPTSKKLHPPKQHHHHVIPQVILNPVTIDRSDTLTRKARNNIHRLAQLQMKSDIAYEQMIIDEKLRKIDLNSMREFQAESHLLNKYDSTPMNNVPHSNSDTNVLVQKRRRKMNKPRPLDWTLLHEHTPPFKHKVGEYQPLMKSSFSRLLESSSVIYSYKNNNDN